ncbi:methyltransferase type 11 [Oscillochloris trichoides DG-6]|uniref:Methyltransferase type 11 n=1 Tax=Oscillochloris trichoides DG-6 TaxID=765420 RepID=E1IF95_9CHLR|nr:class I SAM-dependent methyltransferase [Oscillochloris trichoides]EFO80135.1 methyltransferase type 11 [Oscillochloris trichoides DG-6]
MSDDLRDWWEELLQVHEFALYQDYAENLTRQEVDFLAQALSLRGVETILDLACGGGRHSIELAQRGLTVIGLDASPRVLAHARSRASELDLNATFVQGDMRHLTDVGRFDTILIMNSSLGFFDDATNRQVLAGAARALAPGGKLLLQCINPYQIDAYMREFRNGWYQLGSGYVLREARFEPREATLSIDYRYIDPSQSLDLTHPGDRIRLYGFPELASMLAEAGLRPLSVFGDAILPPVPFGETSLWQVLVAVRDLGEE